MDRERFIAAIDLTVDMAHDYALETRIRRLIEAHWASRETPRTLVMNVETWHRLMWELDGRGFRSGVFWTPQPEGTAADPSHHITTYLGLPILVKDFMPDLEVIVGV